MADMTQVVYLDLRGARRRPSGLQAGVRPDLFDQVVIGERIDIFAAEFKRENSAQNSASGGPTSVSTFAEAIMGPR
jgi:hypothetical protein